MNYYEEIKNEFINNEINKKVKNYLINRKDLETRYNVGKLLSEAGKKYGEGIINEYSKKLTLELGKGYNVTNLKRYRQFYILIQKGAPMAHQLSWSQYVELLSIKDMPKVMFYINLCIKHNLTKRQLRERIKSKEYERLSESAKSKFVVNEQPLLPDLVKNPILIKKSDKYTEISEKVLQQIILEDIKNFMQELGTGFCYISNEYPIKIGNNYNYIDLLLYNIDFNCYVVVELKVTKLKKEHIGQIEIYMNYIDKNLKKSNQDKTIGIIICKKDNEYIIEYCSDKRIISREFELV
ncbi:MAG: PDDEXK nuclease domain-containing protein [Tenericutes bacterium]|nr:PDDEXK nuclease domain-containing protein [Mycoplasmatota bacterium]